MNRRIILAAKILIYIIDMLEAVKKNRLEIYLYDKGNRSQI